MGVEAFAARLQGKGWGSVTVEDEVAAVLSLWPAPQSVLDVGGNVGDWTASFLSQSEAGDVTVFEPDPSNVESLRKRFGGESRVSVVGKALGARSGKVQLFTDKAGSVLASLVKRDLSHVGLSLDGVIEVESIRLDSFLSAKGRNSGIDVLKMDIEGLEFEVLSSLTTSSLKKIGVIQFEFGGACIDARVFFRDFWQLLSGEFDIYRIAPRGPVLMKGYSEADEFFRTTNYVAVNKSRKSCGRVSV